MENTSKGKPFDNILTLKCLYFGSITITAQCTIIFVANQSKTKYVFPYSQSYIKKFFKIIDCLLWNNTYEYYI